MGWYQVLYEGNGRGEGPSGPRPKGFKLLLNILRWHWWTLVKANILFCLFCLPVVTIPAALKALTRVCVLLLRGEPLDLWQDWWGAFRQGFLRATAAGVLMAVMLGASGFGAAFYGRGMAESGLLAAPALILAVLVAVLVMSLFSLFPLLEFSELGLGEAVHSALLLPLVAAYVLGYPYSTFVLAAIAFSLFWLITCFATWPGLEKYVFHTSEDTDE